MQTSKQKETLEKDSISVQCPACNQIRTIKKTEVIQGLYYKFVVCHLPTKNCLLRPIECNECIVLAEDAFDPNCKKPVE